MTDIRKAAQQALEAWFRPHGINYVDFKPYMEALRAALAEPEQEMPSDTRYTVAVEGQAPTYWDCIHDAMTNAQRAVSSGVDNATRAIDDLKAGRIAEWSYGFSAVRIYPPQSKAAPTPQPKPQTTHWQGCEAVHPECGKPEQEPLAAWENKYGMKEWEVHAIRAGWIPAPTPRQWVSLTEQEMYDLFFNDQYGPRLPEYLVNTIKCVEAALKEKNNG